MLEAKIITGSKRPHTDQVVSHESELELIVVLELNTPQGPLLGVEVLPEPRHGSRAGVLVGVEALPLIEGELRLAKGLERVLRLLGLGLSGLLLLGLFLLRLLLLLGGSVLNGLLDEDGVLNNGLARRLVDDSGEPSGDGGAAGSPVLVQNSSEGAGEESSSEEVGKSDTLTNKECVGSEMLLKDSDVLQSSLGGLLDVLLVVRVLTHERAVPATEAGEELRVGVRQPTEDGSVVLLGLTQEGGLLILGGHLNIVSGSFPRS